MTPAACLNDSCTQLRDGAITRSTCDEGRHSPASMDSDIYSVAVGRARVGDEEGENQLGEETRTVEGKKSFVDASPVLLQ